MVEQQNHFKMNKFQESFSVTSSMWRQNHHPFDKKTNNNDQNQEKPSRFQKRPKTAPNNLRPKLPIDIKLDNMRKCHLKLPQEEDTLSIDLSQSWSLRNRVEHDYKMRVTRQLHDDDLKFVDTQNVVDRFFELAIKNLNDKNPNKRQLYLTKFSDQHDQNESQSDGIEALPGLYDGKKLAYADHARCSSSARSYLTNTSSVQTHRRTVLQFSKNKNRDNIENLQDQRPKSHTTNNSHNFNVVDDKLNRLIHSAPPHNSTKVKFNDGLEQNQKSSQENIKKKRVPLKKSARVKKPSIDQDEDEEDDRDTFLLNIDKKTILRNKKVIKKKTMSVDKWIEVHKRFNTKAAVKLITKDKKLKKLTEKYNLIEENNVEEEVEEEEITRKNKSLSIRELSEMTVLDKLQTRIKMELLENLRNMKKIESQTEFNSIVMKIKRFLNEIEEFKSQGYSNDTYSNIIKLYEYNIA